MWIMTNCLRKNKIERTIFVQTNKLWHLKKKKKW